jgi:spore coat protein CotH
MKPSLLLHLPGVLLAVLLAVGAPAARAAGDNVFAGKQVHTIAIEFSQPAWWDSLTIYYNQGLEQYLAATVTIDGEVFDSVGVRFKGNVSYYHPNNKKPFRLKFDEYVDDQRWDGLKGVHLNNCWEDPTFMREKLHFDFCRDAGIPAPRANFAELYLNGELWGFYSLVEHVDKTFLSSRYGNNSGNLYKAVDAVVGGGGLISDFKWYGSDPSAYYARYELKTDDSPDPWTDLIAVIDSLNNSPDTGTALPPVVDMDALYRATCTDVLLGNLDSYVGSGRNFYIYFDAVTGKMRWIPWDMNMSFGSYWGAALNFETLSLTYVSSTTDRPLIAKIHGTPGLADDYLYAFCEIFNGYFSADRLFPEIDEIADLIRPYVYADPRKMFTNEQFETNIDVDVTVGGHRKPGLKSFITARQENVQSQLAALGVSCEPVIEPGDVVINEFAADNTIILDPAGEAEDWIEFYNNTEETVVLDGLYLTDDPALLTKWQFPEGTSIDPDGYLIVWADDDEGQEGLHANFKLSAGGEFIGFSDTQVAVLDSVTFGPQTTNLTMARVPNGTGPFVQGTPTFGANNGGTGGTQIDPGEVVINEFMADNDSIPDPAGEMEDWIEIYNTTDHEIDLEGAYLSDDFETPTKWQFPEATSIPVDGYLIIWADDDVGQEGLHASFKLSAGGEEIILSNTDLSVVDSTSFGPQTLNLSMARIPNGTGPFVQTHTPTPGWANTTTTDVPEGPSAGAMAFGLSVRLAGAVGVLRQPECGGPRHLSNRFRCGRPWIGGLPLPPAQPRRGRHAEGPGRQVAVPGRGQTRALTPGPRPTEPRSRGFRGHQTRYTMGAESWSTLSTRPG